MGDYCFPLFPSVSFNFLSCACIILTKFFEIKYSNSRVYLGVEVGGE